jgi:hypothetical protein
MFAPLAVMNLECQAHELNRIENIMLLDEVKNIFPSNTSKLLITSLHLTRLFNTTVTKAAITSISTVQKKIFNQHPAAMHFPYQILEFAFYQHMTTSDSTIYQFTLLVCQYG